MQLDNHCKTCGGLLLGLPITQRQAEVLELWKCGYNWQEIAVILGIGHARVAKHFSEIKYRTHTHSAYNLYRYSVNEYSES